MRNSQRDQDLRDAVHYLSLSLTYLREGKLNNSLFNLKASFRLRLAPTGIGDFIGAGVGSPQVRRPGDWNHADLHINASDPHLRQ